MSIVDRIRALFGRKPSGAEYAAATGAAAVATFADDPARDAEPQSESGASDGGWSGGDAGGGGGGDSGGGGG